jgi:hypothetical protein
MNKTTSRFPRIEISPKYKIELAQKHNVTLQAVRNALKFHSESELANNIRKDAIALLESEAKSAKKLMQ